MANRSDRTLVPNLDNPAQMSFLRFSLPPQSFDLNVQSGLEGRDIIPVGTGFAVTSPVPPGEHSVEFSYFFTYEGNTVAYRQGLHQGADIYQALVPEGLASVRVSPLELANPMNIQDTRYQVWEAEEIGPGQGLMLEFTGLPQPGLLGRVGKVIGQRRDVAGDFAQHVGRGFGLVVDSRVPESPLDHSPDVERSDESFWSSRRPDPVSKRGWILLASAVPLPGLVWSAWVGVCPQRRECGAASASMRSLAK